MGKTKDVLSGYTSIDMISLSCIVVKDPNAAAIPYYSRKKNKIKSVKFNKRNMKDYKVHLVNLTKQEDSKTVLVVNPTKIKIGKTTGMGYTISLKGLKENIDALIDDSSPALERIYSFKILKSNKLIWVWDSPEYDMFIELKNGKFIGVDTDI